MMNPERKYEDTNFITGLRAIAIFLVFLIHSGGGGLRELGGAFNRLVDFGAYGVPMFFVISGFTIFYQLISGKCSFGRFLKIRISRISIPYFPILLGVYVFIQSGGRQFNHWAIRFNDGAISIDNLLAHLTYLASFSVKYANTIIGVEWSLHVEIFFYLVIGYVVSSRLLKLNFRSLSLAFIPALVVAVVLFGLGYTRRIDPLLIHWMPFRYAWMFVLGGGAYYLRNVTESNLTKESQNRLSNCAVVFSISCVLVLLSLGDLKGLMIISEGVFAVLTFLLIVCVRDGAGFSILLNNRVVLWLGGISFSFYLWHFFVIESKLANSFSSNASTLFALNFFATTVVSYVWFRIFEVSLYQMAKRHINRSR